MSTSRDLLAESDDSEAEFHDQEVLAQADVRDRAADVRDREAEARDAEAEVRDQAWAGHGLPAVINSTPRSDRAGASSDRQHSASDRAASARDRLESSFDELTGAYRRTPGMVEARREVARSRRVKQTLTFVFVDIDGLKSLNDTGGHVAGDALLRDVGHLLREVLRNYDLLVRYGGDEFVCILSNTSMADAAQRFDSVSTALAARSPSGSISIGVAELTSTDTVELVVARADAAMYQGRNQRDYDKG